MTHRSRQNNKDRVLRYLDLSFEGRHHQHSNSNGHFGPAANCSNQHNHGALRPSTTNHTRGKGGRGQPAHRVKIINKPVDYRSQLEDDIQRLLEAEGTNGAASTGWSGDVTRQPPTSPEPSLSPPNYRLAPSKLEQQATTYQYNKVAAAKASSSEGAVYARPNTGHKYLMASDKRPRTATGYDGEHRLGRPTRTTLLRARQRCNSAPITSYETRQDQQRRAQEQAELKKAYNQQTNQSLTDLLSANIPAGESMHSYLIGARYNSLTWIRGLSFEDIPRAHHLDDKSLKEHGVYLPRYSNGPAQNCFVIKKMKLKQRKSTENIDPEGYQQAATPERPSTASSSRRRVIHTPRSPSTPLQQYHERTSSTSPLHSKHPTHSKSVDAQASLVITSHQGRSPPVVNRQAWSEKAHMGVNGNSTPPPSESTVPPMSVDVVNTSEGISIKGTGFIGSPPKIARPSTTNHSRPRSLSANSSYMVQGRSIYNMSNYPINSGPYHPPSAPSPGDTAPPNSSRAIRPKSSVGSRGRLTAQDVSLRVQEELSNEEEEKAIISEPEEIQSRSESPGLSISGGDHLNVEKLEVMSTGSEEELSGRIHGPSPSPAGSPRSSPPMSPSLVTPREEPQVVTPEPHPQPQPEPLQAEAPVSEPKAEPEPAPQEAPSEAATQKGSEGIDGEARTSSIMLKPKRAASARTRKPHVRFADEVPESSLPDNNILPKDPIFMTDKEEESPEVCSNRAPEQRTDNSAMENAPMPEPVVPAVVIDGGDVSVDLSHQSGEDDTSTPDSTNTKLLNNGSGDASADGMPENGFLSPGGYTDETDNISLASEEHLQPVKVISVDIVQKVPPMDKT